MNKITLLVTLLLSLWSVSCQALVPVPVAEEPPTLRPPTATATVYSTATPTATLTLTPTATPVPPTSTPSPSPSPSPTASPTPLPRTPLPPPEMVLIPAGSFVMGGDPDVAVAECRKFAVNPEDCPRGWFLKDTPVHTVTLDTFYVDKYEVSNAQYAECVAAGRCETPIDCPEPIAIPTYRDETKANYPVICVTWDMAKAYCEWRDARLPTEAEWEKAARGTDERFYPWGNEFDASKVNFCDQGCNAYWRNQAYDDGYGYLAPVDSYPTGVSPYGVYNMAGNAMEWVVDWYQEDYYSQSPASNPTGPSFGLSHVVRGGAWSVPGYATGISIRIQGVHFEVSDEVGFRCARSSDDRGE